MKYIRSFFVCSFLLYSSLVYAQAPPDSLKMIEKQLAEIEKKFQYEHGKIDLKSGMATINVPNGFKYLNTEQSVRVIRDLWGNPADQTKNVCGMLFPENGSPLDQNGWAFVIEYDLIGYVNDEDAETINYDELLKEMQSSESEENAERAKMGFPSVHLVGWAQKPFYDKDKKILHWAKEIAFGGEMQHTLNYNIRILGRRGVLNLNAVSDMSQLSEVNKQIPVVANSIDFQSGHSYFDFDPKVDQVAAWTVGGLVAGKVLAKVGFFAIILKFWKVGVVVLIGLFSLLRKKIFGTKDNDNKSDEA